MSEDLKYVASIVGFDKVEAGLNRTTKALVATSVASQKLDSTLGRTAKGTTEAAQALQNVGRIAQDLPFGFIGIANNLNPLLESFQRLKKESGSTGGALKSLAGSLVGGGGVGLAFSAVTAALSFASIGLQSWTGRLGSSKKVTDESANATNKLAEAYDSIVKSLSEENTKIQVLVAQLKDENITRAQRAEAIKQLQSIAPAYFSTLDKEKSTIADITLAYEKYAVAILRTIEARVREKELIGITEKIIKLQDKGRDVGAKQLVIDGKLVSVNNARVQAQDELTSSANAYQQFMKGTLGLTQKEQDELSNLLNTQKELIDLVAKNKGLESLNTVATVKKIKTVKDVIAELALDIDALNVKGFIEGVDESKAKVTKILSAITELITKFKVAPDDTIIQKLIGTETNDLFGKQLTNLVQNVDALKLRQELQKKLEEAAKAAPIIINVPIRPDLGLDGAFKQVFADVTDAVNAQMETLAEGMASVFGETLGKALAGGASVADFFKGIFQELGQAMIDLGKFFIKTGIQIKIIKSALLKNPLTAIIAGVALVAIGSLIKARTSQNAFATGVRDFVGGTALVGERGRELVQLPRGSNVIPAAQTAAIMNQQMVFIPDIRLAGQDIVIAFNRASATINRNG